MGGAANILYRLLRLWLGVTRQSLKGGTQSRVADPVGRCLDGLCCIDRKVERMSGHFGQYRGRLHLKQNPGQAGELIKRLQLALQTLLLVTQASSPMAIRHDQQQAAFAP